MPVNNAIFLLQSLETTVVPVKSTPILDESNLPKALNTSPLFNVTEKGTPAGYKVVVPLAVAVISSAGVMSTIVLSSAA